jgi:hypothetical protein
MNVVIVNNWNDSRVTDIASDCMERYASGIYFHHRLGMLIIVNDELHMNCFPTAN